VRRVMSEAYDVSRPAGLVSGSIACSRLAMVGRARLDCSPGRGPAGLEWSG